MLFSLPCNRDDLIDQQSFGKLIYNLNLVSKNQTCYKTEPSVVISNELFRDFRYTQALPDNTISEIVRRLTHLHIANATVFMSFFEDCDVMDQPITIRVSDVRLSSMFFPLPDFSILSSCIDYLNVNSSVFHYYSMNINGGMPRRYHRVKRLKTDLRIVKIRVEDINKALDLIYRLI